MGCVGVITSARGLEAIEMASLVIGARPPPPATPSAPMFLDFTPLM